MDQFELSSTVCHFLDILKSRNFPYSSGFFCVGNASVSLFSYDYRKFSASYQFRSQGVLIRFFSDYVIDKSGIFLNCSDPIKDFYEKDGFLTKIFDNHVLYPKIRSELEKLIIRI